MTSTQDIKVSKNQLRALQTHRDELDTDSGAILVGVIAQAKEDGFWYGHVELARPSDDQEHVATFSLSSILSFVSFSVSSLSLWP